MKELLRVAQDCEIFRNSVITTLFSLEEKNYSLLHSLDTHVHTFTDSAVITVQPTVHSH